MILMIDNYDSFTYNLVDYLGQVAPDQDIKVYRNDAITLDEIKTLNPDYIVISPGPKTPSQAGISKACIETFGETIPILGVCLGHQSINEVYGGETIGAKNLMHGKTSPMTHTGHALFKDVPKTFTATRYHSLTVNPQKLSKDLEVIAIANDDNEIMAIAHKIHPVYGLQFHPESICTPEGLIMLKNFLSL